VACDSDEGQLKKRYRSPDFDGSVESVAVDCSDEQAVARLADQISERYGKLDILVINGRAIADPPLLDIPDGAWADLVGAHLDSAFFCAKHTFGPGHRDGVDTLTHGVCWLASVAARFVTGTVLRTGERPVVDQLEDASSATRAVTG
jgi:NAD(P)-dependent dehydrogenase (short-subunit alcohol dehydrogenase family)